MAGRIYDTARWKHTRRYYLQLNPICEVCKTLDKVRAATQVDHVTAMAEGGAPYAMDNLMALCQQHHSRKTVLRDRGFGNAPSKKPLIKGCRADGRPIDPGHHWNRGTTSS